MKRLFLMLALLVSMTAGAQNVETLYTEGKALYDAKDYVAALAKLRPAAEKGHKKAQYRVGRCYDKGYGVEESNEEAIKWYQKSADQGYYKAEYQLARAYVKGKGVPVDEKKAKMWLKRSIGGKKHGAEKLQEIKDDAAAGDKTDKRLLELL
ncbi:MAG: sel1 repeat family protein [Prevotella sp.]|nr:sel1 repeat family protein [Prevotella sp.]MCR5199346.1 sel1 repeat family protein [Prevotella sp.]